MGMGIDDTGPTGPYPLDLDLGLDLIRPFICNPQPYICRKAAGPQLSTFSGAAAAPHLPLYIENFPWYNMDVERYRYSLDK